MKMASRISLCHLKSSISSTTTQFLNFSQTSAYLMPNIKKFGSLANPSCFSSVSSSRTRIQNDPVGNLRQNNDRLLQKVKKFGFLTNPSCVSSFSTASAQFRNYPVGNLSQINLFLLPKIKKFGFLASPCRNLCTNVDPQPPSGQLDSSEGSKEVRDHLEIFDAFQAAETVEEMLSAIKDMEEADMLKDAIALAYFRVGYELCCAGEDRGKVVHYLRKATSNFEESDEYRCSVFFTKTLRLLGSVCHELGWWNESLGYLEKADTMLRKLEEEGLSDEDSDEEVKDLMLEVQKALVTTKNRLEKKEDAIGNVMKILEIQEVRSGKDSCEVGRANLDVAKLCAELSKFKEALPYCLKALEIHELKLGNSAVEVVRDRLLLGVIYTGLEEHGKALEQNQLAQEVLKDQGLTSDLLSVVTDTADVYTEIGKNYEAFQTLNAFVSLTDRESMERATLFISMAQAVGNQEKLADSKKSCLEVACRILGSKEESSPFEVYKAYDEISMEYQEMKDFENAISYLKKSLALLEKFPQGKHVLGDLTARMGWLLRLAGKMELSISSYEDAVELLKESYGKMHFKVASAYNNMGCAYNDLGRSEPAAHYYSLAQEIIDASFGPHHWSAIENSQILSEAYAAMNNYDLAIKFQERVVEGWKAHGPSRKWEYQDAQYTLEQLKKKSRTTDEASGKAPPLDSYDNGNVPAQNPGDADSSSKEL